MDREPAVLGVVLIGHLGDILLRSSILRPIRRRFPSSKILVISSPMSATLFGDSPHVDKVIAIGDVYLGPFRKLPIPARRSIADRTRRFWAPGLKVDSLIFPGHFTSPFEIDLLELVGSKNSFGFIGGAHIDRNQKHVPVDPKWQKGISRPVHLPPDYQLSHSFVDFANLLGAIGCNISAADLRVEIDLSDDDRLAAERLTASLKEKPYGVIFPGASFNRDIKMWPLDRFADVVRMLGRLGPPGWLICGARSERDDCSRLAALIEASHANVETTILCGAPIRHIAAVLKDAFLVIGSDNGGMHLAVAMERPTVSVVGGATGTLFFPWGDQRRQRAVMHQLDCWGCRYECIHPRVMCIDEISSDRVAAECRSVLDAGNAHPIEAGHDQAVSRRAGDARVS